MGRGRGGGKNSRNLPHLYSSMSYRCIHASSCNEDPDCPNPRGLLNRYTLSRSHIFGQHIYVFYSYLPGKQKVSSLLSSIQPTSFSIVGCASPLMIMSTCGQFMNIHFSLILHRRRNLKQKIINDRLINFSKCATVILTTEGPKALRFVAWRLHTLSNW